MSVIHLGPPNRKNATGKHYKSAAYEEAVLVRTGPGILNGVTVVNKKAAKVYLFVCDALGTPSIGNTLIPPIPISASDGISTFDDVYGVPFTTGLYVAASSTIGTFTAIGSNDVNMLVDYSVDTTSPTSDA